MGAVVTMILLSIVAILSLTGSTAQSCGNFTTSDVSGPFFEPDATLDYKLAPLAEIEDPDEAVVVRGTILDRNCDPVEEAFVEVWYSGGNPTHYTFPSDGEFPLLYRGKQLASSGKYEYVGTFPGRYPGRPINHIHYKVTARGREFITQLYFRGFVPPGYYEDYVRGRDSQFPSSITGLQPGNKLPNGGRQITFNIRLDV